MLTDIIEALLFAGGKGMSVDALYKGLPDFTKKEINSAIDALKKQYSENRGIILIEYDKTLQFQSNPKYGDILADLLLETRERELSKTLLQVLAIVAYKQPVTRTEIEDLRGVSSDYVIAMLLKLDLIEAVGRKDTVGRPVLYGTTVEFMRKFGLEDLAELPDYDKLMHKIRTNFDKYYQKTDTLYRAERDVSGNGTTDGTEGDEGSVGAQRTIEQDEVAAADDEDAEFFAEEDEDEMPDFLSEEDVVEVD